MDREFLAPSVFIKDKANCLTALRLEDKHGLLIVELSDEATVCFFERQLDLVLLSLF